MPVSSPSSRLLHWCGLIGACIIVSRVLQALHMPAGAFIGPMAVAITFGVAIGGLRLPKMSFKLSQGVIGCLIAQTMTVSVMMTIVDNWPIMVLATVTTLLLSLVVGIVLVRYGGLPGTTAAWGTTPGAAAAMVAMAEEADADPRIVAAMQYVRVVCVVVVGALVSHWLGVGSTGTAHHGKALSFDMATIGSFLASLAIIVGGVWLVDRRMPAGALLGPMVIGTVLHLSGLVNITLPASLLEFAYGVLGCYVGLRFDRQTVRYVMRALGWMVLASMMLIGLCALSAWLLVSLMQTHFITSYLATSPGGLDSMTIIAIDTHADVGLVVALQAMRLFTVVMVGPMMARFIARFAVAA